MSMSKKDFIALADMIRAHNAELAGEPGAFSEVHLIALAEFCRDQNPAFNRQRWMDYINGVCGPNGGKL